MSFGIKELGLWDGTAAVLVDGGSGPPARPPLHLQAAAGGLLRLVGPDGPVLWGRVDRGWYYVDIVRSATAAVHVLPPIRVDEAERAPGPVGSPAAIAWWTRQLAARLVESPCTPLAAGRRHIVAPMHSISSAPRGACGYLERWPTPALRRDRLEAFRAQGDDFELSWDLHYLGLVLTRPLSDEADGRVKMWRKRARDRALPPLLVWWCGGLFSHVLLDGHDRLHAAMLEDVTPDVVVVADVAPNAEVDVERRREEVLDQAARLETGRATVEVRASVMNSVLRTAWDPRVEWNLGTPGFPLDVAQWTTEVGTRLAPPSENAQTLQ